MRNLMGRATGGLSLSGFSLPNTICIIGVIFTVLLACDVVNVQVNTRIIGPLRGRGLAQQDAIPPPDCVDPIKKLESSSELQQEASPSPSKKSSQFDSRNSAKDAKDDLPSLEDVKYWIKEKRRKHKQNLSEEDSEDDKDDDMVDGDDIQPFNMTPVDQKYTFKMVQPGTLGIDDIDMCPGLRPSDLNPVDEKMQFLFILGAQKAGTTWLHSALTRHPMFVEADRGYQGGWNKEPRFFNALPVGTKNEYLDIFPPKKRKEANNGNPTIFLDSSPYSLFSPSVPPRVKQMIPHAKFVIVLRDPVARTVSSHNMMFNAQHRCFKKTCSEPVDNLLPEFRKQRDLQISWPEDLSGCNFSQEVTDPSKRTTWGRCWRCDHFVYSCTYLSRREAMALGGCMHKKIPHVPHMPLLQYGLYAPQIAHWLSFFSPENFLILTREQLQDPKRVLPTLNKILRHVGHPKAKKFTKRMIGKVNGFKGKYKGSMSEDDQQALRELAEFFERPNADLQTLMDTYFPDAGFKGFTPEYQDDSE